MNRFVAMCGEDVLWMITSGLILKVLRVRATPNYFVDIFLQREFCVSHRSIFQTDARPSMMHYYVYFLIAQTRRHSLNECYNGAFLRFFNSKIAIRFDGIDKSLQFMTLISNKTIYSDAEDKFRILTGNPPRPLLLLLFGGYKWLYCEGLHLLGFTINTISVPSLFWYKKMVYLPLFS